jgi:hypothetical protein
MRWSAGICHASRVCPDWSVGSRSRRKTSSGTGSIRRSTSFRRTDCRCHCGVFRGALEFGPGLQVCVDTQSREYRKARGPNDTERLLPGHRQAASANIQIVNMSATRVALIQPDYPFETAIASDIPWMQSRTLVPRSKLARILLHIG